MIIINQEQGNPKSEVVSKNDAKLADTTRVTPYDRNSKQKNWNNHMLAATSKPSSKQPLRNPPVTRSICKIADPDPKDLLKNELLKG